MMEDKALNILNMIQYAGGEARFVGGAVRDSLIGRAIKDIDIACNLKPEETTKILEEKNITVIPTGIIFGTITALYEGDMFEITSLRKDVSTDGRRAIVEYTKDWQEDAARRDFTFNALYKDRDGEIYDHFNGIDDLNKGILRFIGDAGNRIEEDYLRILRLFRFQALFGKVPIEQCILDAVHKLREGLQKISGERIKIEMLKILSFKNQYDVLIKMQEAGVLEQITTLDNSDLNIGNSEQFKNLNIDTLNPITALASILSDSATEAKIESLAERWRFSNREKNLLHRLHESLATDLKNEGEARRICRLNSKEEFKEYIDLHYYKGQLNDSDAEKLRLFCDNFSVPEFPLSGNMLIAQGFKPGKELGQKLKQAEQYWEENNYKPELKELLQVIGI